jgi:serine phosphatase RsbU (regulator of sigma subunit)
MTDPDPSRAEDRARVRAREAAMLLDTPSERVFDRITVLAARVTDAPVALVSLVDSHRQFFKSTFGLVEPWATLRETPLSHAFCPEVVAHAGPLVVTDARGHPLLGDNPAITELEVIAYAGVPLRFGGEILGTLCVIDHHPHAWEDSDVMLLGELALVLEEIIALRRRALDEERDHASRHADQRHEVEESRQLAAMSRRLQRGLLPQATTHEGFDVEAAYEPGSARLLLGGDFADVRLASGERLDFVIGDVSGHGPEAAALAVAVRSGWSALRDRDVPLDELMGTLNGIVLRERHDEDLFATALVGTIDVGARIVELVTAGHPPPILVGEQPRELTVRFGLVLGADADASWTTTRVALEGDGLLAYTDGLVEGRARPGAVERFGVDRLLPMIGTRIAADPSSPGLTTELIAAATAAHGQPLADDVAALFIRPLAR